MRIDRLAGARLALVVFACLMVVTGPLYARVNITSIQVGHNGQFRSSRWLPLTVTVHNSGDRYIAGGSLVVEHDRNISGSIRNRYVRRVDLPPRSRVRVTLYGRISTLHKNLAVSFRDANDVQLDDESPAGLISSPDPVALMVDESSDTMDALADDLKGVPRPYGGMSLVRTNPRDLPMKLVGYDTVGAVILGKVNGNRIPGQAADQLVNYVKQGGLLVVAMGRHYEGYVGTFLAELLPVEPIGYRTYKRLDDLERASGARMRHPGHIDFCESVPRPGAQVDLAGDHYPSIASRPLGMGHVVFLAFDLDQLEQWQGRDWLRRVVMVRTGRPLNAGTEDFDKNSRDYITRLVGYDVVSLGTMTLLFGGYLVLMLAGLSLIRRAGRGEYGVVLGVPLALVLSIALVAIAGAGTRTVENTRVEVSALVVGEGQTTGEVHCLAGLYAGNTTRVTLGGDDTQTVMDQATGEEVTVVCPQCEYKNVGNVPAANPPRKTCYVCQSNFIQCKGCGAVIAVTEKPSRAGKECKECGKIPVAPKEQPTQPKTVVFRSEGIVTVTEQVPNKSLKSFAVDGIATMPGPLEATLKLTPRGIEGRLVNGTGYTFEDCFIVWNDYLLPVGPLAPDQEVDLDGSQARAGSYLYTSMRVRDEETRLRISVVRDLIGSGNLRTWRPGRPTFFGWHRARLADHEVDSDGTWKTDFQGLVVMGMSATLEAGGQPVKVPAGVVPTRILNPIAGLISDEDGAISDTNPAKPGNPPQVRTFRFALTGALDHATPVSGTLVLDYSFEYHEGDIRLYDVESRSWTSVGFGNRIRLDDLGRFFDTRSRSIRTRLVVRASDDQPGTEDALLETERRWTLMRPQLQLNVTNKETAP